ncbi:MAG: putative DNA-binding domain-containing protein [Sphingomonadales bacterium]|nr:putative DNA-binding domain-containing protein [Sphingomonadales bacterium]
MSSATDPCLAEFQDRFAQALLGEPSALRLAYNPAFAVYRNTWRKALNDALKANFPVVAELIGDEAFLALAFGYFDGKATPSPVLAEIGDRFAQFLDSHPVIEDLPYLADIARIERLITEAHLACDGPEKGSPLLSSVRFAWLGTPALTIWEAHCEPGGFEHLAPEWIEEGVLVTRNSGRIAVRRIERGGYYFLRGIKAGHGVEEAAKRATTHAPDDEIAAVIEMLFEDRGSI